MMHSHAQGWIALPLYCLAALWAVTPSCTPLRPVLAKSGENQKAVLLQGNNKKAWLHRLEGLWLLRTDAEAPTHPVRFRFEKGKLVGTYLTKMGKPRILETVILEPPRKYSRNSIYQDLFPDEWRLKFDIQATQSMRLSCHIYLSGTNIFEGQVFNDDDVSSPDNATLIRKMQQGNTPGE